MLTNPAIKGSIGAGGQGVAVSGIQKFLSNSINLIFGLGGLFLFFMLIKGSYTYLTAGGDKEAVQRGIKTITEALVGAALLFSVYAIAALVEFMFGIPLLKFNFPVLQ